jgi:hypothetical protein
VYSLKKLFLRWVLVIILIKQLNDLAVFGKDFNRHIANDVLRIVEEADIQELGEKALLKT